MRVLTDDDVRRISPATAVAAMRAALLEAHRGRLASPPRLRADAGSADYVFTVGGLLDGQSGFRVYRAGPSAGDQLVAVWEPDGHLAGVVAGDELGARRTGALGGVAADVLARPDATTVAMIGTGRQAWTQLWAISAVRQLSDVRIYSRDPERRAAFAGRAAEELHVPARPAASAEQAAAGADIVVLATTSAEPVIDPAAIAAGTHLTTVGPKSARAHETPAELLARATIVTCDSPQQAGAYAEPFFTDPGRLTPLSAVVAAQVPGRASPADITVYCSVGLAGTEVLLAAALFS
jgi:ornithine cyclodeaminase/alanine dehydrogenase-like protein (mu-crystallin family)